jgi:hypothetical protein
VVASAGRRTWDSAAEGAESLGISAPPLHDRRRVRRCVAALGGVFTKWHFIVVIAASEDVPRTARQELPGQGFTCDRGGTLAEASAELQRQRRGWTTMCIRFRPNRFGRSFGRKLGVLYDDYVNNRFVSGCAINKKEEEVVLHTQEVTGSSPVAPTIKINNLQAVRLTSYGLRRRPENQGQSNLWFTRLAASGRAKISAQTSACGDYTLR